MHAGYKGSDMAAKIFITLVMIIFSALIATFFI